MHPAGKKSLFIFLFFLVCKYIGSTAGVPCTKAAAQKCISDVDNITKLTRFLFPPLPLDKYNDMCNVYREGEKCLERQKNCDEETKLAIRDTISLMHHACFTQVDEYGIFGDKCFKNIILKSELFLCSKTYIGLPESMLARKDEPSEKEKQDFCKLTVDVLYCRYVVVEDHCGHIAAHWQHKAYVSSYTTVFDRYPCPIEIGVNFNVERLSLAVFMAVFILLLLIFSLPLRLLFCPPTQLSTLCCPAKKRRNNNSNNNGSDNKTEKKLQIAQDIINEGHTNPSLTLK